LNISAAKLVPLIVDRAKGGRLIIAVAGPPGVGKSTFAGDLRARIKAIDGGLCEILPMDGFHLDDTLLGLRGWLSRKGAPHTFDVAGLAAMLRRLKANEEDEVIAPVFDRTIEIARAGSLPISRATRIILAEGNYLLLTELPWSVLAPYFDITLMLRTPREEIYQRLIRRWIGLGFPFDIARSKVEENDMPNMETVLTLSSSADFDVDVSESSLRLGDKLT
jgi:pantothenate kinase